MSATDTVRDYYEAVRRGEPLPPYFAEDDATTKFGISESLFGYESVAAALREQTRTTDAWTVESRRLTVTERDRHAWFADDVILAWTDVESGDRREFETRWSGTLERRDDQWSFVELHVSTADEL